MRGSAQVSPTGDTADMSDQQHHLNAIGLTNLSLFSRIGSHMQSRLGVGGGEEEGAAGLQVDCVQQDWISICNVARGQEGGGGAAVLPGVTKSTLFSKIGSAYAI